MATINRFVLFFIITFCFCNGVIIAQENKNYEIYVNQLFATFALEMEKEFGLVCVGSGGKMPYDIEEISIKFSSNQKVSIEEARDLEVTVTERFLKKINSDENIRPFLREYPFNAKRGEVAITFRTPDNKRFTDGSIAYVTQFNNKISYCADKESSPSLILLKEEPYEEALKIVADSRTK